MQQQANLNKFNYDDEPIRLFQSNFLELFTHCHPAVVALLWLPIASYFMLASLTNAQSGAWLYIPLTFALGVIIVWTFIEYVVHRFIFHMQPKSPMAERLLFLLHEVHHVQPNCKTRLVLPPIITIPGALVFYALFQTLVGSLLGQPEWINSMFAGFMVGYVAYDLTHYAVHHFPLKGRFLKALKRHHMLHHFENPQERFGVTSPLWDFAFKTQPDDFMKTGR